jgi:hypothetical protein
MRAVLNLTFWRHDLRAEPAALRAFPIKRDRIKLMRSQVRERQVLGLNLTVGTTHQKK